MVSSCVMLERLYVLPVPTNCPLRYQPLKLVLGRLGTWKVVLPPLCTLCCCERAKIPPLVSTICRVTVYFCTSLTTTCRAAVLPFAELAISWVVPELTPTTLPSSILAIASLSDAHLMLLSLALSGVTVAVGNSPRSPTFKLTSVNESATVCTGISKTA